MVHFLLLSKFRIRLVVSQTPLGSMFERATSATNRYSDHSREALLFEEILFVKPDIGTKA